MLRAGRRVIDERGAIVPQIAGRGGYRIDRRKIGIAAGLHDRRVSRFVGAGVVVSCGCIRPRDIRDIARIQAEGDGCAGEVVGACRGALREISQSRAVRLKDIRLDADRTRCRNRKGRVGEGCHAETC